MALVNSVASNKRGSDKTFGYQKGDIKFRKPQRNFIGKMIKYTFIGFNILMVLWFITGMSNTTETITNSSSEVRQTGTAIGNGFGVMRIIMIWAFGGITLGIMAMLTAPKV